MLALMDETDSQLIVRPPQGTVKENIHRKQAWASKPATLRSIRNWVCPYNRVMESIRRAILFFILLMLAPSVRAAPITLDDFDGDAPFASRWTATSKATAARVAAPEDVNVEGVQGRMLRFTAEASAGLYRLGIEPRPKFETCDRFLLRVHAPTATKEKPVIFELIALEGRGQSKYWRKITVEAPGWRVIEVPLRWMRPGDGRAPRWNAIDGYGIFVREGGTLELDGIELIPGEGDAPASLTPQQIAAAAFDKAAARIIEREGFTLITDAAALDADKTFAALAAMKKTLEHELPGLPPASRSAMLLVFAEDKAYREFWPRFAASFDAQISKPTAAGFTAMGLATTSYSDQFGPVRPVYVHEACHALLADRLRLTNRGEWLHEGLATRYTLAVSGEKLDRLVRDALDEPTKRMPLDQLLTGEPIPLFRYWQAASVIDWLLDDADRARRFNKAIAAMSEAGSTDLRKIAEPTLGMKLSDMETAWLAWARMRYGK